MSNIRQCRVKSSQFWEHLVSGVALQTLNMLISLTTRGIRCSVAEANLNLSAYMDKCAHCVGLNESNSFSSFVTCATCSQWLFKASVSVYVIYLTF